MSAGGVDISRRIGSEKAAPSSVHISPPPARRTVTVSTALLTRFVSPEP